MVFHGRTTTEKQKTRCCARNNQESQAEYEPLSQNIIFLLTRPERGCMIWVW